MHTAGGTVVLLQPVVATASFPLINLPNFYLSFTILVSLILVKYPDRVGLVNTVPTVPTVAKYGIKRKLN